MSEEDENCLGHQLQRWSWKDIANFKLAAELAWRGMRVLVIDLDPQASLTFSFISPDTWSDDFASDRTIKSWFDGFEANSPANLGSLVDRPPRVRISLKGNGDLALIYSHLGLINVDLELATKLGGSTLAQAKRNFIEIHRRLADNLPTFEEEFDLILIDCPPNFNIVTKTAIVASDFLLVPAKPDYLSTLGIEYLIRSVNELVSDYNKYANLDQGIQVEEIDPKVLGVVFTMIQEYGGGPIKAHQEFISQVTGTGGIEVFENYIKRNATVFADAPQTGVPVVLKAYANGSHSSVVEGLESVANEFVDKLGL